LQCFDHILLQSFKPIIKQGNSMDREEVIDKIKELKKEIKTADKDGDFAKKSKLLNSLNSYAKRLAKMDMKCHVQIPKYTYTPTRREARLMVGNDLYEEDW
jgi:hypothetical protein